MILSALSPCCCQKIEEAVLSILRQNVYTTQELTKKLRKKGFLKKGEHQMREALCKAEAGHTNITWQCNNWIYIFIYSLAEAAVSCMLISLHNPVLIDVKWFLKIVADSRKKEGKELYVIKSQYK